MKVSDVFGIKPGLQELSYIDRGNLDGELRKLIDRKQTHIAIRGASKAGKSWLRQKVLNDPIVVQCRLGFTPLEIYSDALSKLNISLEVESTGKNTFKGSIKASGEAGWKLLAKVSGGAEFSGEYEKQRKEKPVGKDVTDLGFIASLILESGRNLVVEDFHYLSAEEQRRFAFDLKTLWDYKLLVIIVGVWISENMLITLNPDLSDRIEELSVTWQLPELKAILNKGCGALNLQISEEVATKLGSISYGSAGLLQKLALRYIDDELGISDKPEKLFVLADIPKVRDAAMHIAEQLNQLYQAFAKRVCDGIRVRQNSTGIYAHAMAAIMNFGDDDLVAGISAKAINDVASKRQSRVNLGNLKIVLAKFPELQVDADGRGLVLAYDAQDEKINVVDKQVLLYRQFATVKWPWEELIVEMDTGANAYT